MAGAPSHSPGCFFLLLGSRQTLDFLFRDDDVAVSLCGSVSWWLLLGFDNCSLLSPYTFSFIRD